MGIRISVAICATSFLMGLLFTHWIADSLTLWRPPTTDEHLWTSAQYYAIMARGPPFLGYILLTIVLVGGGALAWSLNDGEAGNLMFDGGSIFLYGTAIAVYLYSVLPNLVLNFSSIPSSHSSSSVSASSHILPFPPTLKNPTMELASSNLVCSVALTGVLALQAGRWWAERSEREEAEADAKAAEVSKRQKDEQSNNDANTSKSRAADADAGGPRPKGQRKAKAI